MTKVGKAKWVLLAGILLALAMVGAAHAGDVIARYSWQGVEINAEVLYEPYAFAVVWSFSNTNGYPVDVWVTNKNYETNYGHHYVREGYHTRVERLMPGQSRRGGTGDYMSYKTVSDGRVDSRSRDRNGRNVTPFTVTRISDGVRIEVTRSR